MQRVGWSEAISVCLASNRRGNFGFDDCKICASMSAHGWDRFLCSSRALMTLSRRHLSQNLLILSLRTTISGNSVQKQLKNFFVAVRTEMFVIQVAYPLGCSSYNVRHVQLFGSWHHCLQKMCQCQPGNKRSAKHLHRPLIQDQTEVEVPLRQCSTVHDVESLVLCIQRPLCTRVDSENASHCAAPQRFDRECPDL